jgi:hypothetical protein
MIIPRSDEIVAKASSAASLFVALRGASEACLLISAEK